MYAKLFKGIGEAWDMEPNDVGMAITLLDYLKQELLQQQMNENIKQKTELIIELIDASIQQFSGNELIKVTSGCTPCSSERNRKRFYEGLTPSSSTSTTMITSSVMKAINGYYG